MRLVGAENHLEEQDVIVLAVVHVLVQAHRHAIGHALGAVGDGHSIGAHEQRTGCSDIAARAVVVELHAHFHFVNQHAVEHTGAALEDLGLLAHGSGQRLLCFKPALCAHVVADVLHHFWQHSQNEAILAALAHGSHLHRLVLAAQHLLGLGAQFVHRGKSHLVGACQGSLGLGPVCADKQVGGIRRTQGVGVARVVRAKVADLITHTAGAGCSSHNDLLIQLLDVLGQLLAALLLQVVAHTRLLDARTNVHAVAELVDAHRVCSVLQLELLARQLLALGDGCATKLGHQCGGHFVASALFQLRLLDDSGAGTFFTHQAGEILLLGSVVSYCRCPGFTLVWVIRQNCRAAHVLLLVQHSDALLRAEKPPAGCQGLTKLAQFAACLRACPPSRKGLPEYARGPCAHLWIRVLAQFFRSQRH